MVQKMKLMSAEEVREYARAHGVIMAYEVLLYGGSSAFKGNKEEYTELLEELESRAYWGGDNEQKNDL